MPEKNDNSWSYKNIGNVDVTNYKKIFNERDDWDNEFTEDRNTSFDAHSNTRVIPLCWSKENLFGSSEIVAPKTRFWNVYYDELFFNDIFEKIKKFYGNGHFVRIVLAKLLPYGMIPMHMDSGNSLEKNCRIHIPIETNENVLFKVGIKRRNICAGDIVEINNCEFHSVVNLSDKDRIHLIIDWHIED